MTLASIAWRSCQARAYCFWLQWRGKMTLAVASSNTRVFSHLQTRYHHIKAVRTGGVPLQVGSRTECALLALAAGLGEDYAAARERHRQAAVAPFSSERKRMSTLAVPADPRWAFWQPVGMGALGYCLRCKCLICRRCKCIMSAHTCCETSEWC